MSVKYAYGYIRVSTHDQEEISPDSQEHLLRDYAAKNNIVIIKIFTDLGISGRKANKRPGFQEMIGLAKGDDHPVDQILVWKFSRFARNQEESIVYKSLLKKQHNVDVVSVSEPLSDNPFGSLIERIIEWMDEYYSIRLSGEVLRGMKENAARGAFQGAAPFGYKTIDKTLVIDPEKADNVFPQAGHFISPESQCLYVEDGRSRRRDGRRVAFSRSCVASNNSCEMIAGCCPWLTIHSSLFLILCVAFSVLFQWIIPQ